MSDQPVLTGATREQVVRFLDASGRKFFVMRNADLVQSLPEPLEDSMNLVQLLVSGYRDHRRTQVAGMVTTVAGEVPFFKSETLEPEEFDELIEWAREARAHAVRMRDVSQASARLDVADGRK